MPVCRETEGLSATIPADGAWHTFSFDLNRLRTASGGAQSANDALQQANEILFNFAGEQATLLLDDIRVLPEEKIDDDNSGNNGSDPGSGNTQPAGSCKYCGGTHSGFAGFFVGLFHRILALFGLRKK